MGEPIFLYTFRLQLLENKTEDYVVFTAEDHRVNGEKNKCFFETPKFVKVNQIHFHKRIKQKM